MVLIRQIPLSCTLLARNVVYAALAALGLIVPAQAGSLDAVSSAWGLLSFSGQQVVLFSILALVLVPLAGFAVHAAILLRRNRAVSERREAAARAQIAELELQADSLATLVSAEPQVLISWRAGDRVPQIAGDVNMLLPRGSSAERVLSFAAWLPPEPAERLSEAVAALHERGDGFLFALGNAAGRTFEISGQAVGRQAIVRIRELTGLQRELAEANLRYQSLLEDSEKLRGFAAAVPWPIWGRDDNGALTFANPAFLRALEAESLADARSRNLDLLSESARDEVDGALRAAGGFAGRLEFEASGRRGVYDVQAASVGCGQLAVAINAGEADALGAALVRMAEAHRGTLNQLSSGVAVFDSQRRLAFYNDSYCRLWNLERAFLDSHPDDSSILDRLRVGRKLQEQPDFRAWKARLHQAYSATEPVRDTWYLPDGRVLAVVTTPNPEGGVTYLFDDVSKRLELERRFDGLIRVQGATLDGLAEGVVAFGSNGRVRLFNPAFARMWKLSSQALSENPHIQAVEGWCHPLYDAPEVWQQIREAVTSIGNRGDVPLKLERKDGSVLDCMIRPLPDGATMLTFQDITDTENVERALRERNEALEAADQMKVDFVHHVSYELRAPLTTIIGFAHFLSDPATGPLTPKQAEYLDYVTKSTNALLALTNNILDLATIDAGAMKLELGPVDVAKAIDAAAEGIQDRLATDHIGLRVEIAPNVGNFVGDEKRVVQVLYNLLANAVGFAPAHSTIGISAWRSRRRVVFTVTDSGPGIPPQMLDKVFDWFESSSTGSRHRGAGLGLSLVRSFVELHGGTVKVESEVGKGTTVSCDFPADQAAQRDAAE